MDGTGFSGSCSGETAFLCMWIGKSASGEWMREGCTFRSFYVKLQKCPPLVPKMSIILPISYRFGLVGDKIRVIRVR